MRLNELRDRLDLKRRFPGYFNVWVFRAALVVVLLYSVAVVAVDGPGWFTGEVYVECPENSRGGQCINPFFEGVTNDVGELLFLPSTGDPLKDRPLLLAGESMGEKPSALVVYGQYLLVLFFVAPFGVNHLLWRRKQ